MRGSLQLPWMSRMQQQKTCNQILPARFTKTKWHYPPTDILLSPKTIWTHHHVSQVTCNPWPSKTHKRHPSFRSATRPWKVTCSSLHDRQSVGLNSTFQYKVGVDLSLTITTYKWNLAIRFKGTRCILRLYLYTFLHDLSWAVWHTKMEL